MNPSPSEIFDSSFEGAALATLTLDLSRAWAADDNIAGPMSALREWVKLTFSDLLPLIGVPACFGGKILEGQPPQCSKTTCAHDNGRTGCGRPCSGN